MARRKVDIFDLKQLQDLQNDLLRLKIKAESITEKEMRKVAEYGVKLAQSKSRGRSSLATGATAASTAYNKTGSLQYEITQSSPGAIYFEYGTGIPALSRPHPNPPSGFTGYTSRESWVYKDKFGNFHTTSGQPANRQMYDTGKELREFYTKLMGGAIKNMAKELER